MNLAAEKQPVLRNFEPGEILVFSVANKPLSFRKKLDTVKNATYESIGAALKQKQYKRYAIDDSQYLMAFELFDAPKETGPVGKVYGYRRALPFHDRLHLPVFAG